VREGIPYVLAGDLATNSGFAEGYPGDVPNLSTQHWGGENDSHLKICSRALGFIASRLADNCPAERVDVVCIEKPMRIGAAYGKSNAKSIIRLNTIYGIIGAAAICKGIKVIEVDVQQARVVFIGDGKLERSEAKRRAKAMCRVLGWPCRNADEADSAAIWHYGCSVVAPRKAVIIHPGMHKKLAGTLSAMQVKELFAHG
jgi:Holliday junction resolvasome RuvABC endonuclease subunit